MAKQKSKSKGFGKRPSLKSGSGGVGSVKELKKAVKRGGGGGNWLKRIPADGITVRLLEEPDRFFKFFEHYDEDHEPKYYPCVDGDCQGCEQNLRSSKRFLVNALDVEEGKVVPLVLPSTLASSMLKMYDKFGTLLDRDYELTRDGTGLDTEYAAMHDGPSKLNTKRYADQLLDLEETLIKLLEGDDSDDDDDDDDKPAKKGKSKSKSDSTTSKPGKKKTKPVDDDDADDEDEPPARTKKRPSKPLGKSKPGKKPLGKKKK